MKNVVGKSDADSLGRRLCIDTYILKKKKKKMVLRQV